MPRHIIQRKSSRTGHEELVHRLRAELTGADSVGAEILEELIAGTGSRHVHVIWNEWKALPDEDRSEVIYRAYTDAEGDEAAANITIAVGVTPREALELGLLPYVVQSIRRESDGVCLEECERAFRAEQLNSVLGTAGDELRYATLESAEQAKRRLETAVPGSHWAVVREVEAAF